MAETSFIIDNGRRVNLKDAAARKAIEELSQKFDNGGAQGEPGKDGVSVTHKWDGTVLTVTSASGTSSADLKARRVIPVRKVSKAFKVLKANKVLRAIPVPLAQTERKALRVKLARRVIPVRMVKTAFLLHTPGVGQHLLLLLHLAPLRLI